MIFCSAASKAYWKLDNDGKQQFVDKQETETKQVTSVDIRKAAAKIFKKVEVRLLYIYIYIYIYVVLFHLLYVNCS